MENVDNLLQRALNQHEAGNLPAAESLYHELLDMQSGQIEAMYLLGILYLQQGNLDLALEYMYKTLLLNPDHATAHGYLGTILKKQGEYKKSLESYKRAIMLNPSYVQAHGNLASLYYVLGRKERAIESYREAISLKPDYFEAYVNLGVILQELRRYNEAVKCYRKALQIKPHRPEIYNNMAVVMKEKRVLDKAEEWCHRSLQLRPDYAEAHVNLGLILQEQGKHEGAIESYTKALHIEPDNTKALTNLGSLFKERRRLDEAIACCNQAISLRPDNADAYNNLGTCYQEQGRLDEAVPCYEEAIGINSRHAMAYGNLGMVLKDLGRNEEALECCQRAITLEPDNVCLQNNMGASLQSVGRLDEAIISYEKAITLKPDYAEAHMNRAFVLLLSERYVEGWAEYEWRLQTREYGLRTFHQPQWGGLSLKGRSILVHAEQGYGDTIQFVRYLPLVKEMGGYTVFECKEDLMHLLKNCVGIDKIVERTPNNETSEQFDFQVPLMSLPGLFGTEGNNIPSNVPYISLDPDLVTQCHARLVHDQNFRVGLVWAGNPHNRKDRIRSLSLEDYACLADVAGVSFYSLQKGAASEQAHTPPKSMRLNNLEQDLCDFSDTGAVIANLDLVISVDTAVAHLAGAIGKPVWSLLQYDPDWRWLTGRDDTPWYPTMRLFRQARPNDCTSVIEEVKVALIEETTR